MAVTRLEKEVCHVLAHDTVYQQRDTYANVRLFAQRLRWWKEPTAAKQIMSSREPLQERQDLT